MAATSHGKQETVALLLQHGANPSLTDNQGRTALALADANNPAIATVLRQAGAH